MTTKQVVADDTLGQIAKKQWELFRRVKEGTLDPNTVLGALQGIVENEVDQLDIEKANWRISSKVHEIVVEEGRDLVSRVKELGFAWDYNSDENPFVLKGDGRCRKKSCFRLAELTTNRAVSTGVIKIYAELSGYNLATSWELLSFVQQSVAMRIISDETRVIALGDHGRTRWSDTGKESYAHVQVSGSFKRRTWYFSPGFHRDSPEILDRECESAYCYILLRQRERQ